MQIFDNQSAFTSLSAVPCPLEKLALPVSIWAGKGKKKHPSFIMDPAYLSYLGSFFLFLVSIHSHFPVLYHVQSAFTASGIYLNMQRVWLQRLLSNCQKRQKDQKKRTPPPPSFSHFLWLFFPTYRLWCLYGFHKQCHLKGATETHVLENE